jgi:hypothetical protein
MEGGFNYGKELKTEGLMGLKDRRIEKLFGQAGIK